MNFAVGGAAVVKGTNEVLKPGTQINKFKRMVKNAIIDDDSFQIEVSSSLKAKCCMRCGAGIVNDDEVVKTSI